MIYEKLWRYELGNLERINVRKLFEWWSSASLDVEENFFLEIFRFEQHARDEQCST